MLTRCDDDAHLYCQTCQAHVCEHVVAALVTPPLVYPRSGYVEWPVHETEAWRIRCAMALAEEQFQVLAGHRVRRDYGGETMAKGRTMFQCREEVWR